MNSRLPRFALIALIVCVLPFGLGGCASDSNGAVTTSGSRGFPADTAATTSPVGIPRAGAAVGSSIGANGLGGGRGSF